MEYFTAAIITVDPSNLTTTIPQVNVILMCKIVIKSAGEPCASFQFLLSKPKDSHFTVVLIHARVGRKLGHLLGAINQNKIVCFA